MARPFIVAQLTDIHAGATWGPTDPMAGLEAAVRAIRSLSSPVAAIVITGDLADSGLDVEYEQVLEAGRAPGCSGPCAAGQPRRP